MKITKYPHSCVLVEEDGTRILIDPGSYTFKEGNLIPDVFSDIDAILITHAHGDHAHPETLNMISNGGAAPIYGNEEVQNKLREAEIECFDNKKDFEVGGLKIRVIDTEHGKGVGDSLRNTSYIVADLFFHGGDSVNQEVAAGSVKVFAFPFMQGVSTDVEMFKLIESAKPEIVFPIHDGFCIDAYRETKNAKLNGTFESIGVKHQYLRVGESMEV